MSYYGNLYQNEELSHRAKTVYMYLHDAQMHRGLLARASKRIASDLKLSRRTVQRALGDLEQAGLVSRQSRYRPNGSLTSNLYQIAARKGKNSQSSAKGGL